VGLFSAQLDNKTRLMLFEQRRKDGSIDPYSSGTFIDEHGWLRISGMMSFRLSPWRDIECRYPVPAGAESETAQRLGRCGGLCGKPDRGRVSKMTGYEGPVRF
jgi:hypothetical protein